MTSRFVDSYFLLALVNPRDSGHEAAVRHSEGATHSLVTTTWVLVEFANALSAINRRVGAARFIRGFQAETYVDVIPPRHDQFDRALELYEKRVNKDWSLTDCLSFLVMEEHGISDALTADHHFEQAGFRALPSNPN